MKKSLALTKKECLIFTLILLIAFLVRFIKITTIPIAFNRDELALAYNAFSIAQTARDERGNFLPLNFESFGDWKLPGYIYSLVPLIKIFGLNDLIVKLPSFLAGLGIIVISFFLMRLWLDKKDSKLAFMLMFFLSILPWAVHTSRIAYEANLALFLFSLGILSFELFKESYLKAKQIKLYLICLAGLSFFLTLLTYHGFQIVTPLFLLALLIIEKEFLLKLFKQNKNVLLIPTILFLLLTTLFFLAGTKKANTVKGSGLLILNQSYQNEIYEKRNFLKNKPLIAKIYVNSLSLKLASLRDNFFQTFSWDFLVTSGGKNGAHNISLIGNLYPYEIIFIFIALFYFFTEKKLWQKKVLLWLITASVAPILTTAPNHTIRFIAGMIPLEILSVYGCYKVYLKFKHKKFIIFMLLITLIYNWFYYFVSYFLVAPLKDVNRHNWALKEISQEIQQKKDHYDLVMIDESGTSLYIYLLYYWQYDPKKLSSNLVYYPHDDEGFSHAQALENVVFALPNFIENENKDYQKILYVLKKSQVPEFIWIQGHYKYLKEFKNDYAKETYVMFEYEK